MKIECNITPPKGWEFSHVGYPQPGEYYLTQLEQETIVRLFTNTSPKLRTPYVILKKTRWKPALKEEYYYIDTAFQVKRGVYLPRKHCYDSVKELQEAGNLFATQKEAEDFAASVREFAVNRAEAELPAKEEVKPSETSTFGKVLQRHRSEIKGSAKEDAASARKSTLEQAWKKRCRLHDKAHKHFEVGPRLAEVSPHIQNGEKTLKATLVNSKGEKLLAEGNILWISKILEVYGNIPSGRLQVT